jgi:uncharacterized DUF497 family protein
LPRERGFRGASFHGETRRITVGMLDSRTVVLVWTPRLDARRIISMRKANEREIERYQNR